MFLPYKLLQEIEYTKASLNFIPLIFQWFSASENLWKRADEKYMVSFFSKWNTSKSFVLPEIEIYKVFYGEILKQRIHHISWHMEKKYKGTILFLRSWWKNLGFLRNNGPSKLRLLQCYVPLWIHVIDAICVNDIHSRCKIHAFTCFFASKYKKNILLQERLWLETKHPRSISGLDHSLYVLPFLGYFSPGEASKWRWSDWVPNHRKRNWGHLLEYLVPKSKNPFSFFV